MADEPLLASQSSRSQVLGEDLSGRLARLSAKRATDPFTNPFLLFALGLGRDLESRRIALDQIDDLIDSLTLDAFVERAERLGAYLGPCDPEYLAGETSRVFESLASQGDFDAFARAVACARFGVVLTGHPTFSLRHDLSKLLVELATGRDGFGRELDEEARAALLAEARPPHGPPGELTLDVEHEWSTHALRNAHKAMSVIYQAAYAVARAHWPERWTELAPTLLTLATWVGFDQDGRTDVSWQVSFEKRLQLKQQAIGLRIDGVEPLIASAEGRHRQALESIVDLLRSADQTVQGQLAELTRARADPAETAAFARAMVSGRPSAMVEAGPLLDRLGEALSTAPDDQARLALLVMRASVSTEGVSLARIHVRLNAGQLHNAIRSQVRLETEPTDPTQQRTYFAAIERLIAEVEPVEINFGDLLQEPASARRLMMTLAQMRKFVDASTPVRFLIAETETGFTLLAALYYARLFGVEDSIEISPLFETEEALERGERIIEEALRSPHFLNYLQRHGRLAIEFGFSDSGRFIGQLAATFRIERLRLRLANLLQARGLSDLEVVFFNTHGESLGRGGHPGSLADRFRYAAPPMSRREFAERGIRIKEEDAFQGGEGYLPLTTPSAALATFLAALGSVLCDDPEALDDPIYDDPDFASEFFATVQKSFASLVHDPDYAALVGLFGVQLLPKSGSRPVQRQTADGGRPPKLERISQLRAIPNNGVLQQLGYLANSLFGLGSAAHRNTEAFREMRSRSPRFRRAVELAQSAYQASDLAVTRAYAAAVDPALWLDRAGIAGSTGIDLAVAVVAERAALSEHMSRVTRRLQLEELLLRDMLSIAETPRRARLRLLHGLRVTLIQRICQLAVQFPDFTPTPDASSEALQERLMRLDVPETLAKLQVIFPIRGDLATQADFAEPSSYAVDVGHAYRREHEAVFAPLKRLYDLVLAISTAINHEIGAIG